MDNGGFPTQFNAHACYWKFWETQELTFLIEILLFQQLCTLLGMGNGIQTIHHYYHPSSLKQNLDFNKDPHCLNSTAYQHTMLNSSEDALEIRAVWQWYVLSCPMYSSRVLAASDSHIRDIRAWGDCAGNTPKAMPAETQIQTLEKWKALGGTSSYRWWHNLKLFLAVWCQLIQMLSLSHHSPLSICWNQLEKKRPHEPHKMSEWKEPY